MRQDLVDRFEPRATGWFANAHPFAFTMPATCRVWYASYDATLVVQTIAGSSNITIPVRPVTVTSPGGGGFPGGWPH